MSVCLRERIREHRRQAVVKAEASFKGAYEHGRREEWGESRKRHGWSSRLVEQAISGGSLGTLKTLRTVIREGTEGLPRDITGREYARLLWACRAFGMIESGIGLETQQPKFGDDVTPLQRRTYAPLRLRAV